MDSACCGCYHLLTGRLWDSDAVQRVCCCGERFQGWGSDCCLWGSRGDADDGSDLIDGDLRFVLKELDQQPISRGNGSSCVPRHGSRVVRGMSLVAVLG